LAGTIAGTGISISNITFSGVNGQAATFAGGTSAGLDFNNGIILSSGLASDAGSLASSDADTNLGGPGDTSLNALAGTTTYDAATLSFDFQFGNGSTGGNLYFNFIFASEEYPDFIGSGYNDAFGIFLNGNNIANIPGTNTPVSINTINSGANSGLYNDNTSGTYLNVFGGFSKLLQSSVTGLGAGTHSIKFAIGDAFDQYLDSAVFLQAGSFGNTPVSGDSAAVPEPGQIAASLLVLSALALSWMRRRRLEPNSSIAALAWNGKNPSNVAGAGNPEFPRA
jgi:hypothetical protein